MQLRGRISVVPAGHASPCWIVVTGRRPGGCALATETISNDELRNADACRGRMGLRAGFGYTSTSGHRKHSRGNIIGKGQRVTLTQPRWI
jgi:hypothetical protein